MKSVSVVIPTFNHGQFITAAIDSVHRSFDINAEIIVVNDGSTDNTRELIKDDNRIIYYEQENMGAHEALNFGIGRSSYDIVAILNDDDLYMPNHLINAVLTMQSVNADIFIGRAAPFGCGKLLESINHHIEVCDRRIEKYGLLESLTLLNFAVSTSSLVMKKDVYSRSAGFRNLSMCHDFEFILSCVINSNVNIFYSKQASWAYRIHDTNTSSTIAEEMRNAQWFYALISNMINAPKHYVRFVKDYGSLIGLTAIIYKDLSEIFQKNALRDNPESCIQEFIDYFVRLENY